MIIQLIRYWNIENCPNEPATDYGLDAVINGKRHYIVTVYNGGAANPEYDSHALDLVHRLEQRAKPFRFLDEDSNYSREESEVEVDPRELEEILAVVAGR